MLGQHVYVEADYGQGDVKEGLWLDEYYIMQEDDGAYVWAENAKGYIEKRKIELGEYDENMMRYQILSGLTEDDYIAYPEDRVKEGMKVTHNYEDVMIDDTGMMESSMTVLMMTALMTMVLMMMEVSMMDIQMMAISMVTRMMVF